MTNELARPVRVLTAIQPHSQFRTEETAIERELGPHASMDIELPVRFAETPGTVVENPFLILRVADGAAEWRVLVRVPVTAGVRGEPLAGNRISMSIDPVGAG